MIATLIWIVIYIIVIGAVLWIVDILLTRVPMDATFKQVARVIIYVVALIFLLLLILQLVGMSPRLPTQ